MQGLKKYLTPFLTGTIAATLSSISISFANPIAAQTASGRSTTVTIYRPDRQCQSLVPQRIRVPANQPINAAVGKVLMQVNIANFNVAGYSVNFDRERNLTTIDLRITSNSRRFPSLSSCEQFTLFGSIRQTLTSNSQWGIRTVRFTERGREIRL